MEKLIDATSKNDFLPAIHKIQSNPKLYGKTNQLLYYMDIGMLYHYAQNFDSSNFYLLKAADYYDELFARSVTNEAAAFLINDNVRPYRSKPYELVMLHQIIGLNYTAQNNFDDALVETRRTQLLFNEWERKNGNGDKYTNDAMFHYISSVLYDEKGETDNSMISLYKAVETFKNGPISLTPEISNYAYYMFQANGRESDNDQLKLTANIPKEQVCGLENGQSEVVVIGYAGRAPALDESVWWGTYVLNGLLILYHQEPDGRTSTLTLPAPPLPEDELAKAEKGEKTKSGSTFHIKFSLPGIKKLPSETDAFTVYCNGAGKPVRSIVINDLEKQTEKYLDDTKGTTIARTAVRVVLRTIAAQKAKEKMQTSNPLANLLINVGTDVLADQMEKADTRTCFLLPKTIQIARIPVNPGQTYSVQVAALDKAGVVLNNKTFDGITVSKNEKKFLFYSSFK